MWYEAEKDKVGAREVFAIRLAKDAAMDDQFLARCYKMQSEQNDFCVLLSAL